MLGHFHTATSLPQSAGETFVNGSLIGGTEFSVVRFNGDQQRADKVYAGTTPLTADDVAEAVVWSTLLPAHVNVNTIELMPICQSAAGFQVHRA